MTLGLDLQGGSHILLQLERQDLIDERLRGDARRYPHAAARRQDRLYRP